MAGEEKLTLKLVVDEEKKRVVFAEADKDFVDVLFSFLTLPLGTIIRLLDNESKVGRMDDLYGSVEALDSRYLQTEACKTMLLRPRRSSLHRCEKLKINVDDTKAREFYTCRNPKCCIDDFCLYSSVQNALCGCGQIMDQISERVDDDEREGNASSLDGVFVKGMVSFIITDDLHVLPSSSANVFHILDKLGIEDSSDLHVKSMNLGKKEILKLLRISFVSKVPLSDLYFDGSNVTVRSYTKIGARIKVEEDNSSVDTEIIRVKLILSRISGNVVYAEAGEDFVDLLFSFLAFPLGAIIKRLDMQNSSMGCICNVYTSVGSLSSNGNDFMVSKECKSILLDPTVAPYFGCSNKLLRIDEKKAGIEKIPSCYACFGGSIKCKHKVKEVTIREMNPKRQHAGTGTGGGFARGGVKFMIGNDLSATPFSASSIFQFFIRYGYPITSLEEHEICVGHLEALNLLNACLTSKNPLTDAFSQRISACLYQKSEVQEGEGCPFAYFPQIEFFKGSDGSP